MISWLNGRIIDTWSNGPRKGLVIACAGVGYEVQILANHLTLISDFNDITLWVHHIQREDVSNLYGFKNIVERDLFRKLISISGIGPQIGMSLLNDNTAIELASAIISDDIDSLTKTQGVGKRVAERITIELRNKLQDFQHLGSTLNNQRSIELDLNLEERKKYSEMKETLESIGYEEHEINQAIKELSIDFISNKNKHSSEMNWLESKNLNELIKESLLRLSQDCANQGA